MAGTVRDTIVTSADQTVGVRLDIDDAIHILTPTDVPLQQWLPVGEATNQVKVQWLEEELTPQSSVCSSTTGSGPWVATVADASIFRPGDVLWEVDGSYLLQWLVTGTDAVANTLDLSGFAGNTTDVTDGATLTIIGQYRTEGGEPEEPRSVERTESYNYTQIGQEDVKVTRTARKRGLYGMEDPYDHEVAKKFKELAIRFERSLVLGVRAISGDSKKRFMGGLLYYITTNSESGTKANAKSLINALLKKCYRLGGAPDALWVSPEVKVAISENIDPTLRRSERSDRTGGFVVDHFLSDFGEIPIYMSRHLPKTKGLALQREFISRRNFDPYFHEMLAKTGDSEEGQIVGEFTLEVKNQEAGGVLTITDA